MPYVHPHNRAVMNSSLNELNNMIQNTGDIQYAIAVMVQDYLATRGVVNYKELEAVMGALSGALHEFQRQVVDPYEDSKIEENGGVYNSTMYKTKGY